MKKFLLIALIFSAMTYGASAQVASPVSFVSQYGSVLDTSLTGNLTKYLTLSTQPLPTSNIIEVALTGRKISGTVGGTATLQSSLDGTNWYTVPGTSAYTITDGDQVTGFKVTNYCGKYLRIAVVGSGTMSLEIKAKYNARRVFVDSRP